MSRVNSFLPKMSISCFWLNLQLSPKAPSIRAGPGLAWGHLPMCKDGELDKEKSFDFSKHVDLSPEAISAIQVHSLTEMGYELQAGQLDFGYCEPFRFLTDEGLKLYRESLTSPKVTANCYYSCEKVPLTVRNATAYSTFLYEMSTDSSLLGALQELMNCGDLLQWHPFQVEQMMTNIQQTGGSGGCFMVFLYKLTPFWDFMGFWMPTKRRTSVILAKELFGTPKFFIKRHPGQAVNPDPSKPLSGTTIPMTSSCWSK